MPVINGVYTKDFPALGRAPIDTDIIPIAEVANQITFKTTIGEIFNAKVFGTTGAIPKFTSGNTLGDSIITELSDKIGIDIATPNNKLSINSTDPGSGLDLQIGATSYARFGIINPGVPGEPGVDNDCFIGSTINNDFLVRTNNIEALRIDTAQRLTIANIQNALADTDKFLVSEGGVVKYRTGTELRSDIGAGVGSVTSVGLTMPPAFAVANSPITSAGTLEVTATGSASQYIRGDGTLATIPSTSSGGANVNYYLNGSVAASVATYKQMDYSAIIGGGTDFNLTGNGLIAQFLTDAGNPNRLLIPGGAWNFEMYFNVSSSGGNSKFYVELLKYDGTTFTSIASSVTVPEEITGGTTTDLYITSLAVPETALLITDRLALRVYIVDNSGGRTVTLHTEDNTLCLVTTTFAGGIAALNGLTANTQYFATGTTGTDFNISSVLDTHTFNLPTASATNRGALSSANWTTFNNKVGGTGTSGQVAFWNGSNTQTGDSKLTFNSSTGLLTLDGDLNFTGAQTIQTSTGNLTLASAGGNGNIVLTPNGTGNASLIGNSGGATVNNTYPKLWIRDNFSGNFASDNEILGELGFYSNDASSPGSRIRSAIRLVTDSVSGNVNSLTFWYDEGSSGILSEGFRLNRFGNLLIGTTANAGFRLDVNGTARVQGQLTTTADAVVNGVSVGLGAGAIASNTRLGNGALAANTTGANNISIGVSSLFSNQTGSSNNSIGVNSLFNNTTGNSNTSLGNSSLLNNTTGSNNVALGSGAGRFAGSGTTAMTSVNNSMYLGFQTRGLNATGSTNEIVIGYDVVGLGSNTTVLGNSSTITSAIYGNLLLGSTTSVGSDKLQVTGTASITGQLKLGSTITNNTFTYTLPSATGTLALTSQLHDAVTLSAIGSTPNANGATLTGQVLNLQPASASFGGVITTGTQTFAGDKTFSSASFGQTLNIQNSGTGYGLRVQSGGAYFQDDITIQGFLKSPSYTYTLPSATGTLALTSNLSAYLPLIGGTLTGPLGGTSATFSGLITGQNSIYQSNASGSIASNIFETYNAGATELTFKYPAAGSVAFTNGTTRLTITPSGNLGLGVTPSAWFSDRRALQIQSGGSINGSVSTPAFVELGANFFHGSLGDTYLSSNQASKYRQLSGGHEWYNSTGTPTAGNAISFTQAMTLTAAGRLLIGTTSEETYKLDVNGTGRFSGALTGTSATFSGPNIFTGTSIGLGSQRWIGSDGGAGLYLNTPTGSGINFAINYVSALIIASTGAATLSNLAGTGSRAVLADANGLLSAPVSDISVKENIQTIGYGLNEIVKMNPVWFDFVDDYKNFGEGRQNGNIAQEMQKIIPEAVFTTPSTGKMGINYDQLHAVYIKAIQELKAEIELLKNK